MNLLQIRLLCILSHISLTQFSICWGDFFHTNLPSSEPLDAGGMFKAVHSLPVGHRPTLITFAIPLDEFSLGQTRPLSPLTPVHWMETIANGGQAFFLCWFSHWIISIELARNPRLPETQLEKYCSNPGVPNVLPSRWCWSPISPRQHIQWSVLMEISVQHYLEGSILLPWIQKDIHICCLQKVFFSSDLSAPNRATLCQLRCKCR